MKLKQFFHPMDASFSTSIAARKLLRLFTAALMVTLAGGLYAYLNACLEEEVSLRRTFMSDATSQAQRFFSAHEVLLKNVTLSAICETDLAWPARLDRPAYGVIRLEGAKPACNVALTQRNLAYLSDNRINLLYVAATGSDVLPLTPPRSAQLSLDPKALHDLLTDAQQRTPGKERYWLDISTAPALAARSSLYLFNLLDQHQLGAGWLGLEIDVADVVKAIKHAQAGDFLLLNEQNEELLSSSSEPGLRQALLGMANYTNFGFVGAGMLPDYIVMRSSVGYAGLQLVYATSIESLVPVLGKRVLIVVLLALVCMAGLYVLMLRIERRLITPAIFRKQALIEGEAFSRKLIQTAPVALCVLRRTDGMVVLENTLSAQWLGQGDERESLSRDWIEQAYGVLPMDGMGELLVSGRSLHLSFSPTRYKGEDVLLCAFSDISAHKQVEASLEQAKIEADDASDAKTLFLATMSHEIRTPLYGVLGTLELLALTELNGRQKDYVQSIQGSSATLLQLICNVLDVSKIEAGQLMLEVDEFAPQVLIKDVVKAYSAAAQSKGLHLYVLIDPQLPDRLKGDAPRIRQVLNNLLSNAVKFTDSGHIGLRVKVENRDDERITLFCQVADTGAGISLADQTFLFDPFYQASGMANVVAGTGLGLSICRRLTSLMSGSLTLVSEPGLGSSFTLRLPLEASCSGIPEACATLLPELVYVASSNSELAGNICGWLRRWGALAQVARVGMDLRERAAPLVKLHSGDCKKIFSLDWPGPVIMACHDVCVDADEIEGGQWQVNLSHLQDLHQAVSEAQGLSRESSAQERVAHALTPLGLHLLIVEDNAINQLILKDQLEQLACTADITTDGYEALALWQAGVFDMVLSDINMPRMTGYELARELSQRGCEIPVIGITANAQREDRERCLQAGMVDCLVKPFGLTALHNCLSHWMKENTCPTVS